jgi:uroporphyrinogen-III synthase
MRPLALIRPAPGWQASADRARDIGLESFGEPLFAVRAVPWDLPDVDAIDALLLASANALRHGGPQLAALAGLPAYAVGETTASAARAAGFDVVAVGDDDLQAMASAIAPGHRSLLRLSGRNRGGFAPPAGSEVAERVVYSSDPLPLSPRFAAALALPAVIALHSPRAARHFAAECDRLVVGRSRHALAALSPRVADAAGPGWQIICAAPTPTDTALLAMAAEMCKTAPEPPELSRNP